MPVTPFRAPAKQWAFFYIKIKEFYIILFEVQKSEFEFTFFKKIRQNKPVGCLKLKNYFVLYFLIKSKFKLNS